MGSAGQRPHPALGSDNALRLPDHAQTVDGTTARVFAAERIDAARLAQSLRVDQTPVPTDRGTIGHSGNLGCKLSVPKLPQTPFSAGGRQFGGRPVFGERSSSSSVEHDAGGYLPHPLGTMVSGGPGVQRGSGALLEMLRMTFVERQRFGQGRPHIGQPSAQNESGT